MSILVTGGTGFIGSHLVLALIEAGLTPIVVDDCSNSRGELVIERIAMMSGVSPVFVRTDVRNTREIERLIEIHDVDAIMHLAGRKHVPESTLHPVGYARINVDGLASVVEAAHAGGVRKMIFSSSGSVYGPASELPIPESAPHRPTNPYSATKSFGEHMLRAHCEAHPDWRVVALRYFNPGGAHPSGLLGEDPIGHTSNLLPSLMAVATGNKDYVEITGDDYPTPDATGVRDYVHVVDVAEAHLRSLRLLLEPGSFEAINIGRGVGVSVGELVSLAQQASGREIPFRVRPRRPGDVAALFADTALARDRLGLTDYRSALEICRDAWRWSLQNPDGYLTHRTAVPISGNDIQAAS